MQLTLSPVDVSVAVLDKMCSPFRFYIWNGIRQRPIKKSEVARAIEDKLFESESYNTTFHDPIGGWRAWHIRRVAYLVVHEDPTPLSIDVGISGLTTYSEYVVQDGFHRLAAAIYRGQPNIKANISGALADVKERLGIDLYPHRETNEQDSVHTGSNEELQHGARGTNRGVQAGAAP